MHSTEHRGKSAINAQRVGKLEALLARATDEIGEAAPLLANLLSVPTGDRYIPLDMTPRRWKAEND